MDKLFDSRHYDEITISARDIILNSFVYEFTFRDNPKKNVAI